MPEQPKRKTAMISSTSADLPEHRQQAIDACLRQAHADFNPATLPLKNARNHVLAFALRGLSAAQRHVLHTIAAFRMPATWETLRAVLVGEEEKPCRDDCALDATLTELEDRGLVGWDKAANRYDLHPIVRGVVWQASIGISNARRECTPWAAETTSIPPAGAAACQRPAGRQQARAAGHRQDGWLVTGSRRSWGCSGETAA